MANWGFLSTLFSSWRFPIFRNGNKYFKTRNRRNLVRLIVSLGALLYFGFFLKKIYEVPVYVTKIDALASNCVIDKEEGVHIFFTRNFDREDKNSVKHDSLWRAYYPDKKYSGGIIIYGLAKVEQQSQMGSPRNIQLVNDSINGLYKKYNYPPIEESSFFYLSIQSSIRQDLAPIGELFLEEPAYFENKHVARNVYNGSDFVNDTLFYHKALRYSSLKHRGNLNGLETNDFSVVSKEDSLIEFNGHLEAYSFGLPTLLVAEDVSKLVEIIYIDFKNSNNDSLSLCSFTKTLSIDYVGPAEFSSHIVPEPDKITLSSICYTDSSKIQEIGKRGLKFHVTFPDMENKQESRIFILSAIVTALGALVLKYLWRIIYNLYKKINVFLKSEDVIRYILDFMIVVLIILFFYKLIKGIYYSNVDPFSMFNPLID